MSAQCQNCTAPSPAAFLCRVCTSDLRAMLRRLAEGPYVPANAQGRTRSGGRWYIERRSPGLIENLADHAVGKSKLGEPSKRTKSDEVPLPFNGRASDLLDGVRNTLSTIVRDVCESRGTILPPSLTAAARNGRNNIGVLTEMPRWLSGQISAISGDESAGQHFADVDRLVKAIERAIDRRTTRKWLGECPTWDEDTRRACGMDLYACDDAIEVYCRKCRCAHKCARLKLLQQNDLDCKNITWDQVLKANRMQPEGFRIDERKLRHWRANSKLKIHRFLRPCSCLHPHAKHHRKGCALCECERYDGREVINRHSDTDEPLYRWPDVRKLRTEVPKRKARTA